MPIVPQRSNFLRGLRGKEQQIKGSLMNRVGSFFKESVVPQGQFLREPVQQMIQSVPVPSDFLTNFAVGGAFKRAPIKVFTGADKPFTRFDVNKLAGRTDAGFAGRGAYTTTNPEVAKRWGINVMETTIPADANLIKINSLSELNIKHGLKSLTQTELQLPQKELQKVFSKNINKFTKEKIAEGFDGVEWTMSSGDTQFVIFKPDKLKFKPIK